MRTGRPTKASIKATKDEVFTEIMAHPDKRSATQALIAVEPELADKRDYAKLKAHRVLKRTDIQAKIQKKLEQQSVKALTNVMDLLNSENENIKSDNTWKVIEQLRGKAIARNLNVSAKVNIEDALFE